MTQYKVRKQLKMSMNMSKYVPGNIIKIVSVAVVFGIPMICCILGYVLKSDESIAFSSATRVAKGGRVTDSSLQVPNK